MGAADVNAQSSRMALQYPHMRLWSSGGRTKRAAAEFEHRCDADMSRTGEVHCSSLELSRTTE
jgi:hypothetical protein